MIPQSIPRSKYYAPIRAGAVLGKYAFGVRCRNGYNPCDLFAAGPKVWREEAEALSASFPDPVAKALFVESFCVTAHGIGEGAK